MPRSEDKYVGKRIRQRRWQMGLTQKDVAEKISVKFQQLQKYETGANRVSASRLWDLSQVLEVTPGYFFEGLGSCDGLQQDMPLSATESRLLSLFRTSSETAQIGLMNIAKTTAQVSA